MTLALCSRTSRAVNQLPAAALRNKGLQSPLGGRRPCVRTPADGAFGLVERDGQTRRLSVARRPPGPARRSSPTEDGPLGARLCARLDREVLSMAGSPRRSRPAPGTAGVD